MLKSNKRPTSPHGWSIDLDKDIKIEEGQSGQSGQAKQSYAKEYEECIIVMHCMIQAPSIL